ncbi:hypothetical protein M1466_00765 [Candidatus Dependentiae bacterium]|nr:hypothetical protein [Candidatus Dependentiae bacterium]
MISLDELTRHYKSQHFIIAGIAVALLVVGAFFITKEIKQLKSYDQLAAIQADLHLLKESQLALLGPIEQILTVIALKIEPQSTEHGIALTNIHDLATVRAELYQETFTSLSDIGRANAGEMLRVTLNARKQWNAAIMAQYQTIIEQVQQFNQHDPIVQQILAQSREHQSALQQSTERLEQELQLLS